MNPPSPSEILKAVRGMVWIFSGIAHYDQTFMEFYVIVVVSIHSSIIFACVSFVAGKLATFMEMSDIGKYLFWE